MRLDRSGSVCWDRRLVTPPNSSWPLHQVAKLGLFVCLLSCGDEELFARVTPDPRFPGEPGAAADFEHLLQFEPQPNCRPRSATALDLHFELRVFRSPEISMAEVQQFLGGLQRFYDSFGVKFSIRHEVLEVPFRNVMNLREEEIEARRESLGLPDTREDTLKIVFHNLIEFMRAYAEPARDEYNLVVVEHAARGSLVISDGQQSTIVGLGLGPRLFAKGNQVTDLEALLMDVGLPERFTPTAFVAASVLRTARSPDLLVAHEFGHAVGMPHVTTTGNLMFPSLPRDECQAELNGPQMQDLNIATGSGGLSDGELEVVHSPEFIDAVFRTFQPR